MIHDLSRRAFLGTLAAAGLLPRAAHALTAAEAERLVGQAVGDINRIIASGASEGQMVAQFAGIFDRYGDGAYIAAFALGNDRRRASPAQIRAFSEAFGQYLASKYGRRFREFIGGRIEIRGTAAVNDRFEVTSTAVLRGQPPFEVVFWVSERPGRPVFFNMVIEGVNMLLAERTEIGAMLDRRGGDIDALIMDLRNA